MLDFDSLYREFAPRIHRFVLGLSGDAAVAEDVTAETFVRVWATRDRVRHETVRAFLFTIARNLWLQGIRSQWRHRELDAADADPSPGPDVQAADRIDRAIARRDGVGGQGPRAPRPQETEGACIMNVTRNVIADLLPLYEAGEASADTRALVEQYLKEHPDLRAAVSVDAMLKAEPASRPEQEQRAALERTRSLLRLRTILFGVAIGANLMTFSFAFSSDEGITWMMWRDAPRIAGVLLVSSMGFWLAYFRVHKQLEVSGM